MIKAGNEVESWTIDPASGNPRPPVDQPGYYPGFHTMSQRKFWDDATRRVIENRVYNVPPIRFFNEVELILMTTVADRIVPQDDRTPPFRIPIVNAIDERLFEGKIDGYRFDNMPSDREAYRTGLRALNQLAEEQHGKPFADLMSLQQDALLKSIHDGQPHGAHDAWQGMSIERFWYMLVQDCVDAYYSHPWSWDEIGFGGPAYPRAYTRLENGMPEPWEVDEKRYRWEAPSNSLSDVYEPMPGTHQSVSGEGGTH